MLHGSRKRIYDFGLGFNQRPDDCLEDAQVCEVKAYVSLLPSVAQFSDYSCHWEPISGKMISKLMTVFYTLLAILNRREHVR
jgi:hypothetical protein